MDAREFDDFYRATAALPPSDPVPAPSDETITVTAALRQLPPDQRHVLVLHYLLHLSVADIAHETSCALGTVNARLARGGHSTDVSDRWR